MMRGKLAAVARDAILIENLPIAVRKEGDLLISPLQQELDGSAAGLHIVDIDPVGLRADLLRAAEDHARHAQVLDPAQQLVRHERDRQHHAVDLLPGDQPLNGGNAAERRRAVRDDEVIVVLVRGSLDAEDGVVEEIVGVGRAVRDIDDQRDRVRRAVGKAARNVVGNVFELLHRGRDLLLRLVRNDALLIEHARNRRRRNARQPRHILDRCCHPAPPRKRFTDIS